MLSLVYTSFLVWNRNEIKNEYTIVLGLAASFLELCLS